MDLDALAEELYALPREEFTAARDARAKEARAAGRRDLADALKKLTKPSAAAWLANRLAREHPEEVRSLLDLGDALRAATAARDGAELRRLAPRQHELLRALADRANRLAEAAGQRVTDDTARGLDDTLRAAVADPELGEQLAAGRLTDVLQHSGFPTLGFGPAPPAPAPARIEPEPRPPADATPAARSQEPSGQDTVSARRRAARLGEAEKELADARSRAEAAESARVEAEQELADAADESARLGERIRRLRDELSRAEAERKRAGQREARARGSLERAETAAAAAAARQARAAAALERLVDG